MESREATDEGNETGNKDSRLINYFRSDNSL